MRSAWAVLEGTPGMDSSPGIIPDHAPVAQLGPPHAADARQEAELDCGPGMGRLTGIIFEPCPGSSVGSAACGGREAGKPSWIAVQGWVG